MIEKQLGMSVEGDQAVTGTHRCGGINEKKDGPKGQGEVLGRPLLGKKNVQQLGGGGENNTKHGDAAGRDARLQNDVYDG